MGANMDLKMSLLIEGLVAVGHVTLITPPRFLTDFGLLFLF